MPIIDTVDVYLRHHFNTCTISISTHNYKFMFLIGQAGSRSDVHFDPKVCTLHGMLLCVIFLALPRIIGRGMHKVD